MKVRIPISIKLVLGIVVVLLTSLSILSYIAIDIQIEDKKNSTYENQLNQAKIASEIIASKINASSGLLKQIAAKYKTGQETNLEDVNNVYKNQNYLSNIFVHEIVLETVSGEIEVPILYSSEKNSRIEEDSVKNILEEKVLTEKNLNTHKIGSNKIVISFIDTTYDQTKSKQLVVSGVVDLESFANNFKNQNMVFMNQNKEFVHEINNDFTEDFISQKMMQNRSLTLEKGGKKYLATFVSNDFLITAGIIKPWEQVMAPVYELVEKIVLITMLILFLGIPFAILFSRRLSNPIEKLCRATDEVGRGNFDIKTSINSSDEIGKLSYTFDKMTKKMGELIKEQKEKFRLEKETQTAALVQKTLIPPNSITGDNYQIQSYYRSASECGGDWWGVIEKKNKLYLMIGDATGHGTASALMTSAAQSFSSIISDLLDTQELKTNEILNLANNSIYSSSKGQIMMTFFVAVIDFEKNKISYSNAGHNSPLLVSKDSSKITPLMASGKRLGERLHEKCFESAETEFSEGDKLILYTDGLVENTNLNKIEFGKKKFRRLLKTPATGIEMLNRIVEEFTKFLEGKQFTDDDTTLVVAELIPAKEDRDAA